MDINECTHPAEQRRGSCYDDKHEGVHVTQWWCGGCGEELHKEYDRHAA